MSGTDWLKFIAFHISCSLFMVALLALTPARSGAVALVYRPGTEASETLARAFSTGARLVRASAVEWIVVMTPEEGTTDFAAKAYASGALAILDPLIVGGCADPRQPPKTPNPRL